MKAVGASHAIRGNGREQPPEREPDSTGRRERARPGLTLAYFGVALFIFLYYARPNDWVPGLGTFPVAKIAGLVAILGFLFAFLTGKKEAFRLQQDQVVLILLFAQFCLAIPFAYWRGGAFEMVFEEILKIYVICLVISTAVCTLPRMRRLVFMQALVITWMAVIVTMGYGSSVGGRYDRVGGVLGGVFGNPNELAAALALALPFVVMFMLKTGNVLAKGFWLASVAVITYGVVVTYSRSGLLALAAAVVGILWEYSVRGKHRYLIAAVGFGVLAVFIVGGPAKYADRVYTIFRPDRDPTGSAQARREILKMGIDATLSNPLVGIGPGNFPTYSGNWKGTHNTYVQLSAEAGIPAMLLFLALLFVTFRNLHRTQKRCAENDEHWMMAGALRASLAAYAVAGFFGDTAYHFFPYIMIGYASALTRMTFQAAPATGAGLPAKPVTAGAEVFGAREKAFRATPSAVRRHPKAFPSRGEKGASAERE